MVEISTLRGRIALCRQIDARGAAPGTSASIGDDRIPPEAAFSYALDPGLRLDPMTVPPLPGECVGRHNRNPLAEGVGQSSEPANAWKINDL